MSTYNNSLKTTLLVTNLQDIPLHILIRENDRFQKVFKTFLLSNIGRNPPML